MMKFINYSLIALNGLLVFSACGQNSKNKNMKLTTEKDTVSYSLGANIATNLKQQGFDELDINVMAEAFKDVYESKDLKITAEEGGMLINQYMMKRQQAKGANNVKIGQEFLDKKAKEEGVKKTASGLLYKVVQEGSGATPSATDKVTVHYTGKLIDGKVFDSSVERGQPATFGVNQVIPGWTEALQLMKVGAKYQLFIPANLAYGERGAGGDIGPNETLIFDVELISIEGK